MSTVEHRSEAPAGALGQPARSAAVLENALLQIAGRIEAVLVEEAMLLAAPPGEDYERLIARKNHLALEVMRISQHGAGSRVSDEVKRRLAEIGTRLAGNAALVRRHMNAVGEIAALVAEMCNRASSDGTYSSQAARQGRLP